MNIAIILYGQPREYMKGYNNIMTFIKNQNNCNFDFFYHTWKLKENQSYQYSPWRNIDKNTLIYNDNIINDLQNLYNPISCEIENQEDIIFNESLYKNTLLYNNTTGLRITNINNTLYQMYSRNKARDLLNNYLNENNKNYDFVIFVRFDIGVMPIININELEKNKTYISNSLYPRKCFPDFCIISPTNIFLEWFNIYDKLSELLNNKELINKIYSYSEGFEINAEDLIFGKYIFHYDNIDNIRYFNGGLL